MTTEFDLNFDEFDSELNALSEMAAGPGGAGAPGGTSRARIAAGNGATLLLAATFEEYVRQQVRAAYREKARRAKSIDAFPKRAAATVWRRALERLARTPFAEIEANVRAIDERIASIVSFCLKKELTPDVDEALSHNEHNMAPKQMNALFNQIGIQSICSKSCEDRSVIEHLGCDSAGKADILITAKLDDFFRRRNAIAHAIKLGSSSGPAELARDIEMFRVLGHALSRTIQNAIHSENADL